MRLKIGMIPIAKPLLSEGEMQGIKEALRHVYPVVSLIVCDMATMKYSRISKTCTFSALRAVVLFAYILPLYLNITNMERRKIIRRIYITYTIIG